jgi:hypothetical protein
MHLRTEIPGMTDLDSQPTDRINDWAYVRFREDMFKVHLVPVDDSGNYELIIGVSFRPGQLCRLDLGPMTVDSG